MVDLAKFPQFILVNNDGEIIGTETVVENAKFPLMIPVNNAGDIMSFGDPNAPAYLPEGGVIPTGTTEGDRWISDGVEYQWKPALGASGAWVEVNSVLMAPQDKFAGVANDTNLWIASPPSGLENGFVLAGLRLSGQATQTAMDATNYWSVFVRYNISGASGNNDLTDYTADNDNWDSTAFQFTSQNDAMFLVEPTGPVTTFTMRSLATGTPGNMNAIASVRVHRAKVPA